MKSETQVQRSEIEHVLVGIERTIPLCDDALSWIASAWTDATCPHGFTQERASRVYGSVDLVTRTMVVCGALHFADQTRLMMLLNGAAQRCPATPSPFQDQR